MTDTHPESQADVINDAVAEMFQRLCGDREITAKHLEVVLNDLTYTLARFARCAVEAGLCDAETALKGCDNSLRHHYRDFDRDDQTVH